MNKEKVLSIVGVLVVLAAIVGLSVFGVKKTKPVAVQQPAAIVAKVNDVPITQDQYDQQLTLALNALKSQGVDTSNADNLAKIKAQVLSDLIGNELVAQGVASSGIKPLDTDVDKQVALVIQSVGGEANFRAQLASSSMSESQLRANISKQLAIQAYLLKNIDMSSATVTAAEIKKYYTDNTKGVKNPPSLKSVTDQIRQQLLSSKQQLLVATFVESLKAKAKIETNLK